MRLDIQEYTGQVSRTDGRNVRVSFATTPLLTHFRNISVAIRYPL
ncbi:MAG: hypothetical protein OJF49_003938 [Ktedonobacterales bacterium]|nr:MAG: hypothetical protein OJF49_003938 [Ktedonobacterales bacterium]